MFPNETQDHYEERILDTCNNLEARLTDIHMKKLELVSNLAEKGWDMSFSELYKVLEGLSALKVERDVILKLRAKIMKENIWLEFFG